MDGGGVEGGGGDIVIMVAIRVFVRYRLQRDIIRLASFSRVWLLISLRLLTR